MRWFEKKQYLNWNEYKQMINQREMINFISTTTNENVNTLWGRYSP